MTSPLVSVIVVNYNSSRKWQIVSQCIRGILTLSFRPLEIIVVDNGSTDDSFQRIRRLAKSCKPDGVRVKFIRLSRNYGFTGANNAGFRAMNENSEYVAIINNDLCPRPDALSSLVEYLARNPDVAGVQGKILQWGGTLVDTAGMYLTSFFMSLARANCLPSDDSRLSQVVDVSYADGAFSVYSASAIKTVGGMFDSKLFLYHEDTELGLRLWNGGYKVRCLPVVVGRHYRSLTCNSMDWALFYYPWRNETILLIRYLCFWFPAFLLRIPRVIVASLLKRSNLIVRATLDGFVEGIRDWSMGRGCRKCRTRAPLFSINVLRLYAFMLKMYLRYGKRSTRLSYIALAELATAAASKETLKLDLLKKKSVARFPT